MPNTGTPAVEQRRVGARGAVGVDRRRAAGQDDRLRLAGQDLRDRRRVRHDLGVDVRLAHPAGDQLGVLRPVVDDEDEVRLHAASLRTLASHVVAEAGQLLAHLPEPAGQLLVLRRVGDAGPGRSGPACRAATSGRCTTRPRPRWPRTATARRPRGRRLREHGQEHRADDAQERAGPHALAVADEPGRGDPRMRGVGDHRQPARGELAVQLDREQEVGQLRVRVRPRAVVATVRRWRREPPPSRRGGRSTRRSPRARHRSRSAPAAAGR